MTNATCIADKGSANSLARDTGPEGGRLWALGRQEGTGPHLRTVCCLWGNPHGIHKRLAPEFGKVTAYKDSRRIPTEFPDASNEHVCTEMETRPL